jgi:RNA polymerase sigma factor for flagellar operon FliA
MSDIATDDWREWISNNYSLVQGVVRGIAGRYRLNQEDAEELRSLVHVKLVQDDYAILRKFEGRSSMSTYLSIVVRRIWIDLQHSRNGKWRPSAAARRQGLTAVRLERLLWRGSMSFEEALRTLRINERVRETEGEIERLGGSIVTRPKLRMCPLEEADRAQCAAAVQHQSVSATLSAAQRGAIARAVGALPLEDRGLLTLRFRDGWSVTRLAARLKIDQKLLYRRFDRICRRIRALAGDQLRNDSLAIPRTAATRRRISSSSFRIDTASLTWRVPSSSGGETEAMMS